MEFSVALVRVGSDILLYARGNVSGANLFFGAASFSDARDAPGVPVKRAPVPA